MPLRENKPNEIDGKYCDIVRFVYFARYATVERVQQACLPTSDLVYTWRYLDKLEEWGYLHARQHPHTHRKAYFLGAVGRHWIVKQGLATRELVERVSGTKGSFDDLSHDLTVARIYTAFYCQSRTLGLSFDYRNARHLESDKLGIQPDAWLSVASSKASVSAYVEFTDYLPSVKEMKGKLARYSALYAREGASQLLWFTTSKNRLEFIQRYTVNWEHWEMVYLSLIEDVNKALNGEVWTWCGRPKQRWVAIAEAGK